MLELNYSLQWFSRSCVAERSFFSCQNLPLTPHNPRVLTSQHVSRVLLHIYQKIKLKCPFLFARKKTAKKQHWQGICQICDKVQFCTWCTLFAYHGYPTFTYSGGPLATLFSNSICFTPLGRTSFLSYCFKYFLFLSHQTQSPLGRWIVRSMKTFWPRNLPPEIAISSRHAKKPNCSTQPYLEGSFLY